MATTDSPAESEGFGRVSRLRGIVFRYLTLGSSLAGIVALGALLTIVTWDAFGLWTAGLGWYLVFGVTLVLPTAAFVWYARRQPAAGEAGLEFVTAGVGGIMAGVAVVIALLIVMGAPVWFAYFLTVVGPAAGLWAYGTLETETNWTSLAILGVFLVGPVVGTVLLGPLSDLGRLLGAPGIVFLSVVLPGAGLLAYVLEGIFEYSRRTALAGSIALPIVGVLGVPVVDTVSGMERSVWLILLVTVAVPLGVASANALRDRERRAGFLLPVVLIGGVLLGRTVVTALPGTVDVLGTAIDVGRPDPWLDWQFLNSSPSTSTPAEAGMYPAIIGSVFLIALVAVLTFVLGVGAAIYLEEYAPSTGRWGRAMTAIRINISNLAGVPSVVYGLLGLGIFVNVEVAFDAIGIPYTYAGIGVGTVLTAAFTLSLLILPIVIISAQEAIRAVPDSLRQASYGMGATQWQTVRNVVLPRAIPGVMTGTILALGRAIGETAPLIMIGAASISFSPPTGLFDKVTAMPMQIYATAFLPGDDFQRGVTAAGVLTLLIVLLTMNSVAILLRNKFEQEG